MPGLPVVLGSLEHFGVSLLSGGLLRVLLPLVPGLPVLLGPLVPGLPVLLGPLVPGLPVLLASGPH